MNASDYLCNLLSSGHAASWCVKGVYNVANSAFLAVVNAYIMYRPCFKRASVVVSYIHLQSNIHMYTCVMRQTNKMCVYYIHVDK